MRHISDEIRELSFHWLQESKEIKRTNQENRSQLQRHTGSRRRSAEFYGRHAAKESKRKLNDDHLSNIVNMPSSHSL
jgi:hypothetical protein